MGRKIFILTSITCEADKMSVRTIDGALALFFEKEQDIRKNNNIYIQMNIFVIIGVKNGIKKYYFESKIRIIR